MPFAEQGGNPEVTKPSEFIVRTLEQAYEDIADGVDITLTMIRLIQKYPDATQNKLGVTQEQIVAARIRAEKIEAGELKPVTRDEMLASMADVWAAEHNATKPGIDMSATIATSFNGGQQD